MFKTLIDAQSDILGGSAGKSYRDIVISQKLKKLYKIYELNKTKRRYNYR